jgi:hypothetical protein
MLKKSLNSEERKDTLSCHTQVKDVRQEPVESDEIPAHFRSRISSPFPDSFPANSRPFLALDSIFRYNCCVRDRDVRDQVFFGPGPGLVPVAYFLSSPSHSNDELNMFLVPVWTRQLFFSMAPVPVPVPVVFFRWSRSRSRQLFLIMKILLLMNST